jgi:hypothetical protein
MRVFLFSLVVGIVALVAPVVVAQRARGAGPSGPASLADPAAIKATNTRFAGVWKLIGEETRDQDGKVVPGPNAASGGRAGFITYDPTGYMGVVLAWPKRPPFAAEQPTAAEAATALATYNSYWGSYAVDESRTIVTHQTMGAVMPSFAGTNQERGYTFEANRLTLRPPNLANGDSRSLMWEKVPDLPNLTPTHRKLIGFWKLISLHSRNAKGVERLTNPGMTGFLVYTASGHLMVHMMDPYRRRNVGASATSEESLSTFRTYQSYFGPYSINEAGDTVVHHLAYNLNPRLVGIDYVRRLEFSGKRLTLWPPPTKDRDGGEVQNSLVWERLSD